MGAQPVDASECATALADILRVHTSLSQRYVTELATGGERGRFFGEVVPGQAFRQVAEVDGQVTELIVVGNRGWSRDDDGPWEELVPELLSALLELYDPDRLERRAPIDVVCEGSIEEDDRLYLVFSFGFPPAENAIEGGRNTLYVDPASQLPVRVVSSAPGSASPFNAVTTYEYDETVVIVAPHR